MIAQGLFPELQPTPDERIRSIDNDILALLTGKPGGPLNLTLSDDEKRVLALLRYRRGAARGITIRDMQAQMPAGDRIGDRGIKATVRALRMQFHLPIGSDKGGRGYFIMISADDHAILRGQIIDQVRAELEVLRSIYGAHAALELLGQLQLEVSSGGAR